MAALTEVASTELREAVERMHGGSARLAQCVPVRETHEGKTVWEGVVHVSTSPAIRRRSELSRGMATAAASPWAIPPVIWRPHSPFAAALVDLLPAGDLDDLIAPKDRK
jgi:hypothetical protein